VGVTRWLDEEEQATWRAFLGAVQRLLARLEAELQRDAGMSHPYYEVLVRLSEAPGRALRMSELAKAALFSPSRLSHAVARMERLGWVQRRSCPQDRRGQVAVLTDAGLAALQRAAPGHVEGVRAHLFDQLGPGQAAQLRAICQAVLDHLSALEGEGPAAGAG
jgi:DNA-binding MarR family transcriptional regulator